jgi:DNA (cytosine-5)-methyltransferase 1
MPTALTFFSGAGGMCCGLGQAGFNLIGGNEWSPPIANIWDANHPGLKCDRRSILDIPIEELPYASLYHFSPPCQQHSQSNPNRTTGTVEEDTAIAQKIAAIIVHGLLPQWVTLENVPLYRQSKSWQIIESALSVAGYSVDAQVVNACDYGSPQSRKRFIVRGSLGKLEELKSTQNRVGWNKALVPMLDIMRETTLSKGQHREFLKTNPIAGLYLAQRTGYSVKNGPQVIEWGAPSMTVTAAMAHDGKCNKDGLPSFRSPVTVVGWDSLASYKAWEVRARGLAALQGFPDDWQWPGVESIAAKAIGNAVSVPLGKAIGESLL